MKAKNLFTAVGRLTRQNKPDGTQIPIIILGGKEYLVDPQELMIWTSLNWRLVRKEEIEKLYQNISAKSGYLPSISLDSCVNRLLVRGLLICGSGETEYDALYDLLSSMYIMPLSTNPLIQLTTVLKLVVLDRVRFSAASKLLKRDRRTEKETEVMALARQALLSTAEIIRCVEMGIDRLPNSDSIMDTIYSDRETTSDNISELVKAAPCTKEVTAAIANLYLRQQLVFDRI